MQDQPIQISLDLFGPVSLAWDGPQQKLAIRANLGLHAGENQTDAQPVDLMFQGAGAVELLQHIRTLLEHVDIEAEASAMPRGLQ